MDPPSGRVPEQGPDWFLVATEACGGGTPDLSSVLEVLGYVGIYGCRGTSVEQQGAHEVGGAPRGGALHPRDLHGCSLEQGPSLLDHVR